MALSLDEEFERWQKKQREREVAALRLLSEQMTLAAQARLAVAQDVYGLIPGAAMAMIKQITGGDVENKLFLIDSRPDDLTPDQARLAGVLIGVWMEEPGSKLVAVANEGITFEVQRDGNTGKAASMTVISEKTLKGRRYELIRGVGQGDRIPIGEDVKTQERVLRMRRAQTSVFWENGTKDQRNWRVTGVREALNRGREILKVIIEPNETIVSEVK